MIIVDVETTGIDHRKHSIVSIGAVDLKNPTKQFYVENKIWEGAEIQLGDELLGIGSALDVNGFTVEQINDINKVSLKEAIQLFLNWVETCEGKTLAGHNPYFDLEFLRHSAVKYGIKWPLGYRAVDLHTAVYLIFKKQNLIPPKLGSDGCFMYTGLPPEPKPHNALVGAQMEAEAFSRIIYGKKLLDEFGKYPIPEHLVKN